MVSVFPAQSKSNGVLAVTASQTAGTQRVAAVKPPSQKLKVIVRRLAPSLTEDEFRTAIGDGWKPGQGKVDWFQYKIGKDSKDPAKPSKPSRAYFHMTTQENLMSLYELVSHTNFDDAANTFTSSCLLGPPILEHALYARIPSLRRRSDARAGTIDQDPDYQAFLEEMTNPTVAKESVGEIGTTVKPEKVTSTPLIQYLKEKRVAKIAANKAARKQDSAAVKGKLSKELSGAGVIEDGRKKGREGKQDRATERATKQTVKILNREAAARAAAASSSKTAENSRGEKAADKSNDTTGSSGAPSSKGPAQRVAATPGQVRLMQRGLGAINPEHRPSRRELANAHREERAAAAGNTAEATSSANIPTAPKVGTAQSIINRQRRGRGPMLDTNKLPQSGAAASPQSPMLLLKKADSQQTTPATPTNNHATPVTPTTATPTTATRATASSTTTTPTTPASLNGQQSTRKLPPTAAPSAGATQAFVKHANPSQGVTEELLKQVLETFGVVSMVEIDKRKGFAYVDFVEAEGLKKAMAANPITVARGTVQVMQRKPAPSEKKPHFQSPNTPRGGGGGGRGGRGGGMGRGARRGGGRGEGTPTAPTGPAAK